VSESNRSISDSVSAYDDAASSMSNPLLEMYMKDSFNLTGVLAGQYNRLDRQCVAPLDIDQLELGENRFLAVGRANVLF
jgi:hypothetical protein